MDNIFNKEIPNFGILFTIEEFAEMVKNRSLIDYDGFGNPSNGIKIADSYIYPSELDKIPDGTTHILWYNR